MVYEYFIEAYLNWTTRKDLIQFSAFRQVMVQVETEELFSELNIFKHYIVSLMGWSMSESKDFVVHLMYIWRLFCVVGFVSIKDL